MPEKEYPKREKRRNRKGRKQKDGKKRNNVKFPTGKWKEKREITNDLEQERMEGEPLESPKIKKKDEKIDALATYIREFISKQTSFRDLLEKHLKFALENGYEISHPDFYHTHLIVDRKTGEIVGLVGHAHEWDDKRKKNNYIIFTSVECTSKILRGGKDKDGWNLGFDDPLVQSTGTDLWFPIDANFVIPKKGKKCAKDERELIIKVKLKGGKRKKIRICFKISA